MKKQTLVTSIQQRVWSQGGRNNLILVVYGVQDLVEAVLPLRTSLRGQLRDAGSSIHSPPSKQTHDKTESSSCLETTA